MNANMETADSKVVVDAVSDAVSDISDQENEKTPQSKGLSKRHKKMKEEGHHLNDDSKHSEKTLTNAMRVIVEYAKEKAQKIGGVISLKKTITLNELQEYFHKIGGPLPSPDPKNKKVYIKPDGGIIMMQFRDKMYPILIVEDKVQGTNDILFKAGKKKQACGNAIERGGKNIRGAEMLYSGVPYFSYVLFASGCDFHSSETIAKRAETMNFGVSNHSIDLTPSHSQETIMAHIDATIIPAININKLLGQFSVLSVFVKAHKWDEMEHGSSRWTKEEEVKLCKTVIDKVFECEMFL
jgi:type II restriction enzyme